MWIDMGGQTHRWAQGRNCWVIPLWWPELLLWGISFIFSWPIILTCLVQSLWYISGSSHVCVHIPPSQDGFYWRRLWVSIDIAPFWTSGSLSQHMCSQEDLLTENEKYMVSYLLLGRAQAPLSTDCPTVLILVYWSTGEKCPIVSGLPSTSCLKVLI